MLYPLPKIYYKYISLTSSYNMSFSSYLIFLKKNLNTAFSQFLNPSHRSSIKKHPILFIILYCCQTVAVSARQLPPGILLQACIGPSREIYRAATLLNLCQTCMIANQSESIHKFQQVSRWTLKYEEGNKYKLMILP